MRGLPRPGPDLGQRQPGGVCVPQLLRYWGANGLGWDGMSLCWSQGASC